ncbi:unnamed protein product [Pieris macdunnoughi]|uniref:Uncharacterized protein n=1 Tax=Pieris macdunnoughi TaxID=345717 RepID=A0A821Y6A6_9NEOP|nr:unnamed protein product [Pieris macdunnoughi]
MGGEACACAPVPPRPLAAPEPDQLYDHHSSEEELETFCLGVCASEQQTALVSLMFAKLLQELSTYWLCVPQPPNAI